MSELPIPSTEPPILVRVVALDRAGPWSSLSIGVGTTDDGRLVTFARGRAEMRRIAAALAAGEQPVTEVPRWSVLVSSLPRDDTDWTEAATIA